MRSPQFQLGASGKVGPNVLLTDTNRWPAAARMAIALSKAGCNISALCPTPGHPLLKTRAVQQAFPYSGLRPLDSLVDAIEAADPQIIIPCDDRGVQHLHELHARACQPGASGTTLAILIERSLGRPESYPIVSNRYELLKIASEEGLQVPETKLVNTVDDLKSWQERRTFPVVLKADGTSGGRGVKIAHTLAQAERFFLELTNQFSAARAIKRLCVNRDAFWLRPCWNRLRPPVIAQSHIAGRPANCAVVCWEGEVLSGISVEVVSTQELTGPARIVRVVDSRPMMLAAERIARRLSLSGFFGLDFMIQDESDVAYLIEMNPRCTPVSHLQLGKGQDMIGPFRARLSSRPLVPTPEATQNDLIAYFPQARNSEQELLNSSFLDVPEGEPELVQELLNPWPERTLVFRATSHLDQIVTFAKAVVTRRLAGALEQSRQRPVSELKPAHNDVRGPLPRVFSPEVSELGLRDRQ
jgi:hypothetical protein